MQTYHRLARAGWALFIAYVLAGVYQQLLMRGGDRDRLFPFSSWDLFGRVPSVITDYAVRVLELRGTRRTAPDAMADAGARPPELATVGAYGLIQALGRALRKGDRDAIVRARRALEEICLSGEEPFHYEVVRRTYDPLVHWHGGAARAVQTVGRFDSRAEP